MRPLALSLLLLLVGLPASAHIDGVPHLHGPETVYAGLALILAALAMAWLRGRT